MEYSALHRHFLRTIASQGVLSILEAERILNSIPADGENIFLKDVVHQINKEIKPFKQAIKITNDEFTNEEVVVFLSLGYDDASKAQNVFGVNELEYFRLLIEEIMDTEMRQVTGIHAINLVGKMKVTLTKIDAQKLLNTWCRMHYLDKKEDNYALGIRAIHEFEGYLRENMPDVVQECCLCKQIVFRGYNCPSCGVAVHTRCLNRYLEKVEKWPCCKVDFSQSQLDGMNAESSRLTQSQLEATQRPTDYNMIVEQTQNSTEEVNDTEIIPEISQRITRKRKRTVE